MITAAELAIVFSTSNPEQTCLKLSNCCFVNGLSFLHKAFTKYDGVFPFMAAYIVPQLNNFGENYPQIEDRVYFLSGKRRSKSLPHEQAFWLCLDMSHKVT